MTEQKPRNKTAPTQSNKEQRTKLVEFAWKMRTERAWSHWQITQEWNRQNPDYQVDRTTITKALGRTSKAAQERVQKMAVQTIHEQSAQADHILYMALQAYEASQGDNGGNPAWLKAALDAMAHKAKIQGAYVEKIEFSDKSGALASLADAQSKLAHLIAGHLAGGAAPDVPERTDKP